MRFVKGKENNLFASEIALRLVICFDAGSLVRITQVELVRSVELSPNLLAKHGRGPKWARSA